MADNSDPAVYAWGAGDFEVSDGNEKRYDPNQNRDENGRWTTGGFGHHVDPVKVTAKMKAQQIAVIEALGYDRETIKANRAGFRYRADQHPYIVSAG